MKLQNFLQNRFLPAILILMIGYLPIFFRSYYALLNPGESQEILYHLVANDCQNGLCQKTFKIDLPNESLQEKVLYVGQILNASKWTCDGNQIYEQGNFATPKVSRNNNNQNHIIELTKTDNCRTLNAVVTFPESQKNNAFPQKTFALTSNNYANKLLAANSFVSQDYKIINLNVIVFVLLFSIFIRIVTIDKSSRERTKLAALLALGAAAQSDLLEVWMPFSFIPDLNRWIATIAYCSYVSFSLKYISKNKNLARAIEPLCVISFIGIFLFTQSRVTSWIYFSALISFVYIASAIILKNGKLFFAGSLVTFATFEFLGYKGFPSSYTVPTFLAMLIVSENQRAFLSYLKINRLLKMNRLRGSDTDIRKENSNRVHSIVKIFQRQFKTAKITVLNLSDPEVINILQYSESSALPKIITVQDLPPIFAHVISTGNAIINIHEDSSTVASFRRGETREKNFNSEYFTVLPLFSGKETIGAVALTEYDHTQFESSLNYATFTFCLDILRGLLVEHLLTTPKTESLNKMTKFFEFINLNPAAGGKDLQTEINFFADAMAHVFGWRILTGKINSTDYSLHVTKFNNFSLEIETQVKNGKIYAHKDNRQGPLALAIHEAKPVIIPNTKWLEGVVHENTTKFFHIHGTKTAAFVPVIEVTGLSSKVVAVYWIEGVKHNEITYSDRELFLSIIKTISTRLQQIGATAEINRSKESIAQFVPKHLVDTVMNGGVAQELDEGFLLIFDLKGSTRLAHKISNESFRKSVTELKLEMARELHYIGWTLQQYEWDAFYFTRSTLVNTGIAKKLDLSEIDCVIALTFENWKQKIINEYGSTNESENAAYRICFTHGNISRGIVQEGATQTWTFIGDAIAVVSKVENESKNLNSVIFADDSVLDRVIGITWKKLKVSAHGFNVFGSGSAFAPGIEKNNKVA